MTLADLEAYRLALSAHPDDSAPLVGFRELWDHPEAHTGRQVRVDGRVARVFRQPKVGEFPPLVEAWVASPADDPFCLVFPQESNRTTPAVGELVRFSGTFLKRIRYHGGDTDRLAPLIVGPALPATRQVAAAVESRRWSTTDWMMALGASMVVAVILAGRHFVRPDSLPPIVDPPPTFVDCEIGTDSTVDGEENGHVDA